MISNTDSAVKAFGELVRERRKARGWSQEVLAAEAFPNSTRKGYISLIENGKIPNITQGTVQNVARALGIAPEDIPDNLRWPEAQQKLADQKIAALAATLEILLTGPLFRPEIWVQMYRWAADDPKEFAL